MNKTVTKKNIKILFFGLGGVGQRHLRNILQLCNNPKIAAIKYSANTFEITDHLEIDTSVNIIKKYNISIYKNLKDAVKIFQPDIAIIATPSNSHSAIALDALKNGMHVFLEKPITTNMDELELIKKYLNQNDGNLSINYMMRSDPSFIKLKQAINEKKIGKIISAQFTHNSYFPLWHEYEKYQNLYAGKSSLGGGTILTNIHIIDLLYCLFGLPKRVFTIGGKLSSLEIDVEDTIASLIDYDFPVTLNLSFTQKPNLNEIIINGEEGKLIMSFDTNELTFIDSYGKKNTFKSDIARNDLFVSCLKDFLLTFENSSFSDTSFSNVYEGHMLALKIKESLIENKIVYL
jgi:predicted dehydrogenase